MANEPIKLALNQAQELIGYSVPVVDGTKFSKPLANNAGTANAEPASGSELVEIVDAGEDGDDGAFWIQVRRNTTDPVNTEEQFIFTAENPLGIFIEPQATKDGVTEPITVGNAGAQVNKAIDKITSYKPSKAMGAGILILALIGAVAVVRWIGKNLKSTV